MSAEVLYQGGQVLAMIISAVFIVFWAGHYGIGKGKALLITVFSQVVCFALVFVLTWVENGFKGFGAQNAIRAYPFMALLAPLEAKLFGVDFKRCFEFQTISSPLNYGLGHFACLARMCCFGFHYQEGTFGYTVAHALTGTDQLPMQIFESVSALIIFGIFVIYGYKTKFKVTGVSYAIMQMIFGCSRFFWEFLRDNDKLIVLAPMKGTVNDIHQEGVWGISNLALWAAALFVAGIILLVFLKVYNRKEAARLHATS